MLTSLSLIFLVGLAQSVDSVNLGGFKKDGTDHHSAESGIVPGLAGFKESRSLSGTVIICSGIVRVIGLCAFGTDDLRNYAN